MEEIQRSDERLAKGITSIENQLLSQILNILRDLDRDGGGFLSNDRNLSLIGRLSQDIISSLQNGKFRTVANEWISTFDNIDEINGSIFNTLTGQISTDTIDTVVGPLRTALVTDITTRLVSYPSLEVSIAIPIRQQIMRSIVLGSTYKEAETALRTFLQTDEERLGHISRWAVQLTRDALNQYDGASQQKIADDIGLDSFMFIGPLQDNSRLGCRHMINAPEPVAISKGPKGKKKITLQENRFRDIVLKDGGFRRKDIPKIIERNSGDSGWNPNCTVSSYLSIRNGYNCNHMTIPYIGGDKRQSDQVVQAQNELK